jgi:hypothetical protein
VNSFNELINQRMTAPSTSYRIRGNIDVDLSGKNHNLAGASSIFPSYFAFIDAVSHCVIADFARGARPARSRVSMHFPSRLPFGAIV